MPHIYAYASSLQSVCKFESEAVLDRFNFLSLAPDNGGPFFEDIAWRNEPEVECGTVTAALLSPWDFIQAPAVYDGDWIETMHDTQPQHVWDAMEKYLFQNVHPLFTEIDEI